ncbi:MgtC/SapB family protein [bacterium]|nr:MgtC/SapB family protein [bacterium]
MIDWDPLYIPFLQRLGMAILAGTIIGTEREFRGKDAGLRTLVMITFGSCLFMILSEHVALGIGRIGDPGRIAAQVVTGVGFIGAGTIITSRNRVKGLTTAAMIWVMSAIGLLIGMGYIFFGLIITIMIFLVLMILSTIERKFIRNKVAAKNHKEEKMKV